MFTKEPQSLDFLQVQFANSSIEGNFMEITMVLSNKEIWGPNSNLVYLLFFLVGPSKSLPHQNKLFKACTQNLLSKYCLAETSYKPKFHKVSIVVTGALLILCWTALCNWARGQIHGSAYHNNNNNNIEVLYSACIYQTRYSRRWVYIQTFRKIGCSDEFWDPII